MHNHLADDLLREHERVLALLERIGENHWATWLRSDVAHLQRGDAYGLDHLLAVFGGIGSINDVVVSPANGHPVTADEAVAVNAELRTLLGSIYGAATRLR